MAENELLLTFYGDDFTGSTDAMESLALAGVRTLLFTSPPSAEQIAQYPGIRAIGVAGLTRAMQPDEMDRALRPALAGLRGLGAPIVHYKVCSTFDSSPHVGSIGRVIDVGMDVFRPRIVPIVVGAPSLGRYCVFGNLFARCGGESQPFRLDRHPSMSRHPITPMDEADLRLHLAKQTSTPIALFEVLNLSLPAPEAQRRFDAVIGNGAQAVLIDLLYDSQLALVGRLIERQASAAAPLFVVGSSGVESALCARWRETGVMPAPASFAPVRSAGPIIVVCGSCSPVTAGQIDWATRHGFTAVALDPARIDAKQAAAGATRVVAEGKSVVMHTAAQRYDPGRAPEALASLGSTLGRILRDVLAHSRCRRVAIAGGDTSGKIAHELGIESLEMVGELAGGSPLCRATARGSPADGIEITFKGGQIGNVNFFGLVQSGNNHG